MDRVVEVAFAANLRTDAAVLKANGRISTYESGGEREPKIPFYDLMLNSVTIHFVIVYGMPPEAHNAAARDITAALEAGALRPRVARPFTLAETAAAHEAVEAGKMNGKVVIEIR